MKTEFLKELGLEQETIDKIMAENGKDVEAAKAKFSDYDDLKTQLTDANKTIEGFKAMDIDGIKAAADDWKAKAEQAEKDATEKIAEIQFNSLLEGAIDASNGRNVKSIRANLDIEALKTSKNQSEDIKTALEALKEKEGYLFEGAESTPPPYATGTGTQPINTKFTPEVNAIRMAAGLKTE